MIHIYIYMYVIGVTVTCDMNYCGVVLLTVGCEYLVD